MTSDLSKTGILLLSHGSRLDQGKKVIEAYTQMYKEEFPEAIVEYGFMEMREPNIPQSINKLTNGNDLEKIIVVPVFVAHGLHTRRDIPKLLGIENDFDESEISGGHHEHHHDHDHTGEHHHHHEHRGLPEILAIIRRGGLTPGARALAERIFQILAEAEAKAHGVPLDQVHFHEVGAVDSIVDIVSAAVCLDNLAPDEVIVTGLSEGSGFVRCQHGMIPVPVPAVLNIVQAHGLTLVPTGIQGELVTPTGAAIVAAIRTKETLPASFKCTRTGLGAGKRTYERPSLLRAMMLETEENDEKDTIWKLECNIDDCTGEALGYCMGKLLRSGARDVHYIPVYMKKNRPAYQLDVICDDTTRETLENIIFAETTTIGIRRCRMERTVMKREFATIATEYGDATVKICRHGEIEKIYPEYESAAVIAEKSGMPVGEAGAWIVQKYKEGNKKA